MTTDRLQTISGADDEPELEAWLTCDHCSFAARAVARPDLHASADGGDCRCPSCRRMTLKRHAWPDRMRFSAGDTVDVDG